MPGFMPGIPFFAELKKEDVDGRDKPGHDDRGALKVSEDKTSNGIGVRAATH
jgi:hypothetical protein